MSPIIDPGNFQRILKRAVILPLVAMGALALLLAWQINRLLTTARWVEHTDLVIAQAHVAEKLIIDLETGLRGYLLTGQREFLEPYDRATAAIGPQFADLRQLVSDNPPQVARLDEINSTREQWAGYARTMIALKDGGQDYEAGVRSGQGKRLVDSMRAAFAAFVRTEENLRDERTAAARRTTYFALGTGIMATIILGAALGVLTRRQLQTVSGSYTEALGAERQQREWLSVTLASIGDALIATDAEGRVTFMNPVAEKVTGWRKNEAANRPLDEVFRIVNEQTRATVESPVTKVLREGQIVGLANHTVLIAKDGTERPIDDSGAPIRDENGRVGGVILVFRDISERKAAEQALARRARQSALNAEVSLALAEGDALPQVLRRCTNAVVEHLDAAFARVWTLNEAESVLELQASSGLYTHLDGPHSRVPVGQFKIGLIAEERRAHLTNSVTTDPRVGDREWARREGMVSFAGYPLLVEDRLVGVLAMFAKRPLADDALDVLATAANNIAQAIERRRAEAARTLAEAERGRLRDELIKVQADRLEELSTPLIPLTNQIVVMPLIGSIDEERAVRVVEALSRGVEAMGARVVILDITGVPAVDARVAGALINAAQAMRLLGAEAVLTGIRPGVAQALVGLGVNLAGLVTRKDLQSGLAFAREHLRQARQM